MLNGLFEGFFVVFAAALALGVNRWNENELAKQHGEAAIQAIITELEANRTALEESHDYHQQGMSLIRGKLAAGDQPTPADFPRGFIGPAPVLHVAWDAAMQTGALDRLEFDAVLLLGAIYAEHDDYSQQSKMAGGLIYEELFRNGPLGVVDSSNSLISLIMSFWFAEQRLAGRCTSTLEELQGMRDRGVLFR